MCKSTWLARRHDVDDEGNALGSLPKRPAFASGEIKLDIPPVKRRLSVAATPRDTVLEPGAETIVEVEVKDTNGKERGRNRHGGDRG